MNSYTNENTANQLNQLAVKEIIYKKITIIHTFKVVKSIKRNGKFLRKISLLSSSLSKPVVLAKCCET